MAVTTAPKRADARRNIEGIVAAATELLAIDPEASIGDIAARAGVAESPCTVTSSRAPHSSPK